ncbi:hypothetical protein LY622_13815 [Halomonas sp. M5N1S17]|uniref:hypothetical protein n=1 Tax=Halomonas alkalisoli TaxID=2907158 RepID=UPI001F219741|nr:hypothetical protein [Halomonas alkalisoli]MCE9664511.1 hypothetical protein [Halomonas alkalisoli]
MIRRLMSGATGWLIAGLLGITVYAGMQARHYALQLSDSKAQVARSEQRAEILLEHQRWQRQQLETLSLVLAVRDEQLERDGQLLDLIRTAASNLERDDAETADWADQPSPAAVRQWLRDLTADAVDGAGDGESGRAQPPAQPAAGTDEERDS